MALKDGRHGGATHEECGTYYGSLHMQDLVGQRAYLGALGLKGGVVEIGYTQRVEGGEGRDREVGQHWGCCKVGEPLVGFLRSRHGGGGGWRSIPVAIAHSWVHLAGMSPARWAGGRTVAMAAGDRIQWPGGRKVAVAAVGIKFSSHRHPAPVLVTRRQDRGHI